MQFCFLTGGERTELTIQFTYNESSLARTSLLCGNGCNDAQYLNHVVQITTLSRSRDLMHVLF